MVNNLEELRKTIPLDDLNKYYEESLGKNPEEIRDLLNRHNIEISFECANECYEFCKKVITIEEADLSSVSAGTAHPSFPENVRIELEKCINILDGNITGDVEFVKGKTNSLSTLLKRTLNEPYNVESVRIALQTILLMINVDALYSPELSAVCNIAKRLLPSVK